MTNPIYTTTASRSLASNCTDALNMRDFYLGEEVERGDEWEGIIQIRGYSRKREG